VLDRYLRCWLPDVAMVEAGRKEKSDNLRTEPGSSLERPSMRLVSQLSVNLFSVVVGDLFTNSLMQMSLIEQGHAGQEKQTQTHPS
jgi:hypothetical protein